MRNLNLSTKKLTGGLIGQNLKHSLSKDYYEKHFIKKYPNLEFKFHYFDLTDTEIEKLKRLSPEEFLEYLLELKEKYNLDFLNITYPLKKLFFEKLTQFEENLYFQFSHERKTHLDNVILEIDKVLTEPTGFTNFILFPKTEEKEITRIAVLNTDVYGVYTHIKIFRELFKNPYIEVIEKSLKTLKIQDNLELPLNIIIFGYGNLTKLYLSFLVELLELIKKIKEEKNITLKIENIYIWNRKPIRKTKLKQDFLISLYIYNYLKYLTSEYTQEEFFEKFCLNEEDEQKEIVETEILPKIKFLISDYPKQLKETQGIDINELVANSQIILNTTPITLLHTTEKDRDKWLFDYDKNGTLNNKHFILDVNYNLGNPLIKYGYENTQFVLDGKPLFEIQLYRNINLIEKFLLSS